MAKAGGKKSRNKGASGENEACKLLRKDFPSVCRELEQYQKTLGRDLSNTDPLCIQVKRHKTISKSEIWKAFYEAESSVDSEYTQPIVMFREDYGTWQVATTMEVMLSLMEMDAVDPDVSLMLQMEADQFLTWLAKSREWEPSDRVR